MHNHKTSQLLNKMQYVKSICPSCNNVVFAEKSRESHKMSCSSIGIA